MSEPDRVYTPAERKALADRETKLREVARRREAQYRRQFTDRYRRHLRDEW